MANIDGDKQAKTMQLIQLSHYQILRCNGVDAAAFLQGQCTINIEKLDQQGRYAAHCNPKGRIISNFYAARAGDDILLRLNRDLSATACNALKKYIVFSKAKLETAPELCCIGIVSDSPAELNSLLADLNIIHKHAIDDRHQELWLSCEQAKQLKNISGAGDYAMTDWLQATIKQGKVELSASQSEKYLPQELNLDLIGGVDFKKGCYTGQEVIARLHYKGKLKKHTRLGLSCSTTQLGQALFDDQGTAIGEILQSIKLEHGSLFLALSNDRNYEQENAILKTESSLEKVHWQALPYAIP